ncbi:hypothetical protein, partial [Streptomyces acidiscabies]|uniref:hypothetical protein n=1 Tax=Streptomyces acidiscabies TaxID=42234 RepID=UPI001C4C8074
GPPPRLHGEGPPALGKPVRRCAAHPPDPLRIEHNPSGARLTFSPYSVRPVVRTACAVRAVISGRASGRVWLW